jgi:hypothetical protein
MREHLVKWEDKNPDSVLLTVTSIQDANGKLLDTIKKRTCCIKNLEILGHGGFGVQNVASENGPGGGSFLWATEDARSGKPTYSGFELFNGVKFCKPCTITLRGCSVGARKEGAWLMAEINRRTGCQVRAYSGSTYNNKDGCLPGSCNLFGFGESPNLTYPEPESTEQPLAFYGP